MARPIWTGAITFGLVSVPVAMYSATHDHDVGFHQFEKGTSDRIRYRRVNERTGKEVDLDDIVKGAEVGDGYVVLEQDELDSVAPGRSKSLDIHRFVELAEIDPLYYQKTYWLGPGNDETAKVYGLLRDAMSETGRAAVGTLVMRGKEYLTAIRADGNLLVLQTMYFADEVRDPKEQLGDLPTRKTAKPAEMSMAEQLIDSMSGAWKPADFRDTYTDRVKALIKAKSKGKKIKTADPAPDPTAASDLFDVLRRSVEAASQRRSSAKPAKKAAKQTTAKQTVPKKAAAKKTAAKPAKKATTAKKAATKKAGATKKAA
ncbi:Ku protein [Actinoplanes solisilvae]|uniref:non-homologous end joining protein Ku n=1 Tax=Actinoplanes solisilvae TaxID=2486853 RepID=UPI000FD8D622|nr:Ku protein [Actinoplanes solisilvae]